MTSILRDLPAGKASSASSRVPTTQLLFSPTSAREQLARAGRLLADRYIQLTPEFLRGVAELQ